MPGKQLISITTGQNNLLAQFALGYPGIYAIPNKPCSFVRIWTEEVATGVVNCMVILVR
ncbi:hypothetical protein [Xanthocytophaga flava]|uniref:hypothetical protein n=1 Tax=Xanthocytophaga flava TaxID=3048013 RepID=UPI0028D6A629|nr:hypothetical protein [Xanthocytophaga flavus]MDJ1472156.1 hypothetical protein [Xanthocytophaga flavus]